MLGLAHAVFKAVAVTILQGSHVGMAALHPPVQTCFSDAVCHDHIVMCHI